MLHASVLVFALGATEARPEGHYPTRVGTKLVYATPRGEAVRVVMDVEEKGDAKVVTIGREAADGEQTPVERVRVTAKGAYQLGQFPTAVRLGDAPPAPPKWEPHKAPVTLLDLTAKPGDTWTHQSPIARLTSTAGKTERVKVPAGEFEAVTVDVVRTLPDGTEDRFRFWYARGVGEVKRTCGEEEVVLKSVIHAKR